LNSKEQAMWGVHGGQTGDADTLFLQQNKIALGWDEISDLSILPPDREAFKAQLAKVYPHNKPGAIRNNAGQLFRFVHEMQIGDLVIYPSKQDKHIHIGQVTGGYIYQTGNIASYPHRRPVNWLKVLPRTQFSQGALYEIGSAMSFFQVKNYAEEFRTAIEGKTAAPPADTDETVAFVAAEIEQTTHDFILKTLAQKLKGHPFAEFIAHLLETMGYRTRVSPEGPDGGIDIIAHKDELGFEPPIIKVQVKSTEGNIGNPTASELYGNVAQGEFGLFVTLGTYTNPARNFAKGKSNLRLIDGEELVGLILAHYEHFDPRYKGLLPLKKVYVPEPLQET
jgi:restriction system protein